MDIDLLAKLVRDIILEEDEVTLPGVGTFVAETVPAAFSNKLYTINPPYRKLSFRQRQGNDDLLVRRYASTSGLDEDRAREILKTFLYEMKEVLKVRKTIIFPNLGRLRATKENHFFFVSDENLDIFPEGFGLESISLKAHDAENIPHLDLVVPDTPAPISEETAATLEAEEAAGATVTTSTSGAEEVTAAEGVSEAEEDTWLTIPEEDSPEEEIGQTPTADVSPEKTAGIKMEIEPAAAAKAEAESKKEAVAKAEAASGTEYQPLAKTSKSRTWLKILIGIVILCIAIMLAIAILGRVAPDFIDQFLYTSEELEILRY